VQQDKINEHRELQKKQLCTQPQTSCVTPHLSNWDGLSLIPGKDGGSQAWERGREKCWAQVLCDCWCSPFSL